MDKAIAF